MAIYLLRQKEERLKLNKNTARQIYNQGNILYRVKTTVNHFKKLWEKLNNLHTLQKQKQIF